MFNAELEEEIRNLLVNATQIKTVKRENIEYSEHYKSYIAENAICETNIYRYNLIKLFIKYW